MGTRNLIGVKLDNDFKVAQYGQWDGYLSGQGLRVLRFLKNTDLNKLKDQVSKCRFLSEEELNAIYEPYSTDGWMTLEQSRAFNATKWSYLDRDTGSDILQIIMDSDEPVELQDSRNFLNDGLFCEYAYIIDFDKNMLQVYHAFQHVPDTDPESATYGSKGYKSNAETYYVHLLASFPLDALPEEREFLNLEGEEESTEDDLLMASQKTD